MNIRVDIGERLPPRVRPRDLPPDIVRIAPQYRGYKYVTIEDEIAIVNPRTREVVDVIREPDSSSSVRTTSRGERGKVVLSREQRETLRQVARRGASSSSASADSGCLSMQPLPEDVVRANPDLQAYRYLAIGDEVVLVDPREQRIVDLID